MSNMLKEIQDIVFKVTGREDVTMDTDFIKDLKLNSFDIVNITINFETQFKISIPTRDLRKIRTVRNFIEYMTEKGVK